MLIKTKGIVISQLKYGDNSLICKVFTESEGLISVITNRNQGKKNKRSVFFQTLSCIDIDIYFKQNKSLHRLKEVGFSQPMTNNEVNVVKSSIKFFLAEFLSKVVKEEGKNKPLFDFLWIQAEKLNQTKEELSYFHINFLYEFSEFLGIQPDLNEEGKFLDYREGTVVCNKPTHEEYSKPEELSLLKEYFCHQNSLSKLHKSTLLTTLIDYYRSQVGGFEKLKSKEILEVVFS